MSYQKSSLLRFFPDGIIKQAAERFGTPLFLYSRELLEKQADSYIKAFAGTDTLFCYAMKANSTRGLCAVIAAKGFGADVVSGGELFRALRAGFPAEKIIFSGVGKTEDEIRYALRENILFINAESFEELRLIENVARSMGKKVRFSIRLNPDVDPHTHAYISTGKSGSKFGVSFDEAFEMYRYAAASGNFVPAGVHSHIGSQISSGGPYKTAEIRVAEFIDRLSSLGINPGYTDMGGGWGAVEGFEMKSPSELREAAEPFLRRGKKLILEPGRSIAAPCGILISRVLYRKRSGSRNYIITDGGMNDFLRPSLYGAEHPVCIPGKATGENSVGKTENMLCDIAGPVCESADFLARNVMLPPVEQGELAVLLSAGAYGISMSSNYNSRPRAAEVMIENGELKLLRRRETVQDIISAEVC